LDGLPVDQSFEKSPRDPADVNPPVPFEVLVFRGDEGVLKKLWNLLARNNDSPLQSERSDNPSIIRVQFRNDVWAVIFELPDFREIAFVNDQESCESSNGYGNDEQNDENDRPKESFTSKLQGKSGHWD
jgi:hypothetical protein